MPNIFKLSSIINGEDKLVCHKHYLFHEHRLLIVKLLTYLVLVNPDICFNFGPNVRMPFERVLLDHDNRFTQRIFHDDFATDKSVRINRTSFKSIFGNQYVLFRSIQFCHLHYFVRISQG